MNHTPIELLEYLTDSGQNPFRDWLEGLRDQQARAKIRVRLNRIRLGNFGDCRSVGRGVSELRIPHGIVFILGAKTIRLSFCCMGATRKHNPETLS